MSFVFFFSKIIVFCSSLILCSFLFFFFLSFCCLLSSSTLSIFAGLLLLFLLALQVATAYTHKRASHTHTNAYNRKTFAQTQIAPTYTHTPHNSYTTQMTTNAKWLWNHYPSIYYNLVTWIFTKQNFFYSCRRFVFFAAILLYYLFSLLDDFSKKAEGRVTCVVISS